MTHKEQRTWMIRQLLDEDDYYKQYRIPEEEQDQKDMLRALMNVRMPMPISDEFLQIQDEYLTEESQRAGITDIADLKPTGPDERIYLWQGDITALRVDGIVDACNCQLLGCFRALHNCVDNIIHSKSGIQLRLRCNEIMRAQGHEEPTGRAKITPAYNLPCKYVFHTVGPIVSQGTSFASQGKLTDQHEELLASCYRSCLELAEKNEVQSIAFCCISTGVFGFPQQRAAEIAVKTVQEYYEKTGSQIKVIFNVFKDEDLKIYQRLLEHNASDCK